jgi:hypothetical protein
MTLIIARTTASNIRIAADMRVLSAHETRRGFPIVVLKAITPHPNTCFCFAGSVPAGITAIRSVATRREADLEAAVAQLLDAHVRSERAVDFLVAQKDPQELIRIASGSAESVSASFIGDVSAYDAYQRYFHELPVRDLPRDTHRAEDFATASKMQQAMSTLIRNADAASVGEAYVSVDCAEAGFRYAPRAMLQGGFGKQLIPSGIATAVQFGSAATGGFGYSLLVPDAPGVPVLGIHFFQGRLGLLYAPLLSDEPMVFPSISHDEFRSAVARELAIDINGILIG